MLTGHHDLALHGDYSFVGPVSRTLLHIACIAGKRESVVELLKAGADPNAVDENNGALVVGHDVEERRQGVQRAGRHHDDVYAVLRGAGRRRAVERGRQGEFFLSRPRLRVLGSDGRGGASTAAAAVRWSRGVASVPWGRRAARGRRLFWPGT